MTKARSPIPADLQPEQVVAIVDAREQQPWNLHPLQMIEDTLATGDYSVRGLEHEVAIERKSLVDFIACVGTERDRFERELIRLRGYSIRAVVIESDWPTIEAGEWRSKIRPAAVVGSVLSWTADGIPILLAGDRARAAKLTARLLYLAARTRYRQARGLMAGILDSVAPSLSKSAYPAETIDSFCTAGGADA